MVVPASRRDETLAEASAARKRVEDASADKSEFLANMSHEMRTPLHGIIGMLQLAIDTETSAERVAQLEMARRAAETLLATIGDILDFSRIEARRLELEPFVDDNAVNQEFAAEAVRRLGHVATTADSGAEALAMLARRTFDVVLLDVQMSGLDGQEVARGYRAMESGTRTPIIALTANSGRDERDRCLAAGFDAVLTKPATQATLGLMIREVTGGAVPSEVPDSPAGAILGAVGGNVRLLARVRDAFAMQTPRLLAAVREAIAARDAEALYQTAHTLKGAISNFDVPDAIAATEQLERAGKAADFARAGELLPEFEAAIHDLEERSRRRWRRGVSTQA